MKVAIESVSYKGIFTQNSLSRLAQRILWNYLSPLRTLDQPKRFIGKKINPNQFLLKNSQRRLPILDMVLYLNNGGHTKNRNSYEKP